MLVKYIDTKSHITCDEISKLLDENNIEWFALEYVNWSDQFPYKPDVNVRIAHNGNGVFLQFAVAEKDVRAVCDTDNGRSWEDSCVEFFLSPNKEQPLYYNFEFTCVGFKLIGGGNYGTERGRASMSAHSKILTKSSLGNEAFGQKTGETTWNLVAFIPKDTLYLSPIDTFCGKQMTGNFYKCGDLQPTPHFLSWTKIDAPTPQFHLPQYFGELMFE